MVSHKSRVRDHSAVPVRVSIVAIAKGGEGVGRPEQAAGPTILVPRTAPGDVVDVAVTKHAGALRGAVLAIVQPSRDRVEPPCRYATQCGGCDLMHLRPAVQLEAKAAIVRQALGRLEQEVPELRLHAAPCAEHYRTRARLLVRARGQVRVGYRAAGSRDLVPVEHCEVLTPVLDQGLKQAPEWLAGSRGTGELALSTGRDGLLAQSLRWEGELAGSVYAIAEQRVRSGQWAGVEVWLSGATSPAVIGDPRIVLQAADGLPLVGPAGGFSQASQEMNAQLARRVLELAECGGQSTVELFAGAGNLTVLLAREAGALETVEAEAAAVQAARDNLQARGLKARVRQGDANAWDIAAEARVAVLDPPRTGSAGAAQRLAASAVRRVVMVSCDPATLSRDLGVLTKAGFRLHSADVLDMFPHTSHVETVVVLERLRPHR